MAYLNALWQQKHFTGFFVWLFEFRKVFLKAMPNRRFFSRVCRVETNLLPSWSFHWRSDKDKFNCDSTIGRQFSFLARGSCRLMKLAIFKAINFLHYRDATSWYHRSELISSLHWFPNFLLLFYKIMACWVPRKIIQNRGHEPFKLLQ